MHPNGTLIRRRCLVVVVGLACAVAAGCPDDSGDIAIHRSSGSTVDTSPAPGPTAGPGSPTVPGGAPATPPPCDDLTWALSAMTATVSDIELPPDARTRLDGTAAKLPAEVRSDFETMAAAYATFGDDSASDTEGVGSPAFEVAANRVTAYLATYCPSAG